ncbi:hypothetical protein AMR94_24275 [Bacillus sp. G3(2015)]|nr:hypothetical protein AMR94_24275 [Bacillus sp. G3(2015)]
MKQHYYSIKNLFSMKQLDFQMILIALCHLHRQRAIVFLAAIFNNFFYYFKLNGIFYSTEVHFMIFGGRMCFLT